MNSYARWLSGDTLFRQTSKFIVKWNSLNFDFRVENLLVHFSRLGFETPSPFDQHHFPQNRNLFCGFLAICFFDKNSFERPDHKKVVHSRNQNSLINIWVRVDGGDSDERGCGGSQIEKVVSSFETWNKKIVFFWSEKFLGITCPSTGW